jgi:hypothetical protein
MLVSLDFEAGLVGVSNPFFSGFTEEGCIFSIDLIKF